MHQSKWTTSVAVGNKNFVEGVKAEMGALAIGKKIRKTDDIGPKNAHFLMIDLNLSMG